MTWTVRVKQYKGNVGVAGRKSVYSLYNAKLATYTEEDQFDHKASEGFIKIFGLPVRTYHQVQNAVAAEAEAERETPVMHSVPVR